MIYELDVYSSLGKVDKEVIENFSKSMNVAFPEKYIKLLSEYNWLRPRKDIFDFIDFKGERVDRDVNFYGYTVEAYPGSGTIVEIQSHSCDKNIIIGFTGNGDFICFDYNDRIEPTIILLHHDEYIGERMAASLVSSDFNSFIDSLHD